MTGKCKVTLLPPSPLSPPSNEILSLSICHVHCAVDFFKSLLKLTQFQMLSEDIAVKNFREYLRIRTDQPNPDYSKCKEFLYRLADELKLEKACYELVEGKPLIVMTVRGANESLPSLLLYSHTDVVPVVKEMWKFDPFAAVKDSDGKIYGRGTQDMKSVDEEIGGIDGMEKFVNDESFKKLNVGFALDEGLASEEEAFKQRVINNFLSFRDEQKKRLQSNPKLKLGNVISVNLTKVENFEEKIKKWCNDAGPDVTYSFIVHTKINNTTPTTDDDPWWRAFSSVMEEE
ncbi:Aminoacylase-1 [Toxocara canis]|uniref:Aminoacylase-1 n=1 Tax=Toxocara canis TaxID=6265 RepID=A0A0B2V9T9_TOXCA|nr:Aminoacylase-1 [Toxocara canis]